jgi:hypothetical protein
MRGRDLKAIRCEDMYEFHLVQDMLQILALVKLGVP